MPQPQPPSTPPRRLRLSIGAAVVLGLVVLSAAVGLGVLAVISVALLNVGIYTTARNHLVRQHWEQLAATTEDKREQVRDAMWGLERNARYVAEQPGLARAASAAARDRLECLPRRMGVFQRLQHRPGLPHV